MVVVVMEFMIVVVMELVMVVVMEFVMVVVIVMVVIIERWRREHSAVGRRRVKPVRLIGKRAEAHVDVGQQCSKPLLPIL